MARTPKPSREDVLAGQIGVLTATIEILATEILELRREWNKALATGVTIPKAKHQTPVYQPMTAYAESQRGVRREKPKARDG